MYDERDRRSINKAAQNRPSQWVDDEASVRSILNRSFGASSRGIAPRPYKWGRRKWSAWGEGPPKRTTYMSRVAVSNLLSYQYFTTETCNPSEKELFSKLATNKSLKVSPWTLLSLVHLMRWLSSELIHLVVVFGPMGCFAQFRILRFPLMTVGNCMVGWLARHGWWCKQASTLVKNKPW
jgi:hypothetical protein